MFITAQTTKLNLGQTIKRIHPARLLCLLT